MNLHPFQVSDTLIVGEPTRLIFKPQTYVCANHKPADHASAGFHEVPTCLPFLE